MEFYMEEDFLDIGFWEARFTETFQLVKDALVHFLPNVIAAVLLVFLGWLLAKLFKFLGAKLGRVLWTLVAKLEKKSGSKVIEQDKFSKSLGAVFYWLVFLYFIFFALKVLSLPGINALLSHLVILMPQIISGIIIIFLGFLLGGIVRDAAITTMSRQSGKDPYFLGQALRLTVITIFVIWGAGVIGLEISLLANFINIVLAAVLGAAALGFGLGASAHVSNMIGAYNLKRLFQIGEPFAMGDVQGMIVDITRANIVVDTQEGLVIVPAKLAHESMMYKKK